MSKKHEDEGPHVGQPIQSRRSFLATLGVAGGALMGGGAWGADRGRPTTSREAGQHPLQRSSDMLRLQKPVTLQKQSRRRVAVESPISLADRKGMTSPSTREAALRGLFESRGSRLSPDDFGLSADGDDPYSNSPTSDTATDDPPLVGAYMAGITLTPSGCQYAAGSGYGGPDPIWYETRKGVVRVDTFGSQLALMSDTADEVFLTIWLRTLGTEDDTITHLLELSMANPDFERFRIVTASVLEENGLYYLSETELAFSPTSDDTWVALAEITGSAISTVSNAVLRFEYTGGGDWYDDTFHWLNVIAL